MAIFHAGRALGLVGVPFRSQGRDSFLGLDCIGLAAQVFDLSAGNVRSDYRLRGDHRAEIESALIRHFRLMKPGQRQPGDLLLLMITNDQFHLAVLTEKGFVHADAGLRRVVETPGEPSWPLIGIYRRRARK